MNTVKNSKNAPIDGFFIAAHFPFFLFSISLFQTSSYYKKCRECLHSLEWFLECILAVSLVSCESGRSTARRIINGSNHGLTAMTGRSKSLSALPAPPCLIPAASRVTRWSHAGGTQSHAGGVAHTGQRLDGFGEVVREDPSVLSAAPVAAHPGQGGAAHGVVDGLLRGNTPKKTS